MENLGLNLSSFLSQLINFGVMIFILHTLLYSRILDMLRKRTERIEESIKDAYRVKEQLANAKRDYDKQIAEARQQGSQVIAQAQERAKKEEEQIVAKAREEAERIRKDAREQAVRERDQMMSEIKNQLAELVSMTASRVLQAEVSSKHDKLIEESLSALSRQN